MFILGMLSILQMVCLPGMILTAFLRIPRRGAARWMVVFASSLLVNYLLVLMLTLLHIYTQPVLLVIVTAELAAIFWLYRAQFSVSLETNASNLARWLRQVELINLRGSIPTQFFKLLEYALFLLFLIFAATDIFWLVKIIVYNVGTVFNAWDAIISYNTWAIAWSQGLFPSATSYYPQLIPANWSIAYTLLNHAELQFFPKFIMPLFSFFILVMLLDLALKTRDLGFLIGVVLTRLMIKHFTGEFIADGVMDLPVAFFGFASVYLLLRARLEADHGSLNIHWIIASGIAAAAAALTKQAGAYILLLFPLLAWLIVLRGDASLTSKQKFTLIVVTFGGAFLAAVSWYLYKTISIAMGGDYSNIGYVTSEIYHGAGLLERAEAAWLLLGKYSLLLMAMLPTLFLVRQPYRWIGILVVIPYSLIWMFYFSYETRILALIFPFWAMILGLALRQLMDFALILAARLQLQKITAVVIPVSIALAIAAGAFLFPSDRLAAVQQERQWQILDPGLNEQIRALVEQTGTDITILSQYPVAMLPGMRNTQISFWYNNLPDFDQAMKNPDLDYLLVPASIDADIERELQTGLDHGKFDLLFTSEGAYPNRMFQVNR